MEVPVHSWSGGTASSRRHVGPAVFAASGADRTKSPVAGCQAVSVELAVVEPAVLRVALGRWSLGRHHGPRGSGQVSRRSRQAASCVRVIERRLAGGAAAAAHAGEAPRGRTHSKAVAARSKAAHYGTPDF